MNKLLTFIAAGFVCSFTLSACASEDGVISLAGSGGKVLFGEKCGMCHEATGMGTGILARRMDAELALLENRTDLQSAFISTVVRSGFNTMFPLSRAEVSDDQLAEIIEYLED